MGPRFLEEGISANTDEKQLHQKRQPVLQLILYGRFHNEQAGGTRIAEHLNPGGPNEHFLLGYPENLGGWLSVNRYDAVSGCDIPVSGDGIVLDASNGPFQ
ncbi:hypothetical protein D3C75_1212030 [compost metagenome]